MSWLGLDIGGANLKAADGRGWARVVSFPLWRDPHSLAEELAKLIADSPNAGVARLAVTMTGELCDCFRTKAEGVRHILTAVEQAAGKREVWVYQVDGRLVSVEQAYEQPRLAAASNWHVLARFACRYAGPRLALAIDVGSTTTDIVPLVDARPCPIALDDTERLVAGELLYTGVGRTPICAITPWLPWRGARCPVAAELFATAADAYVVLGNVAEQPEATWTADGRPLTREFSRDRLARMVCGDASTFDESDAVAAADRIRDAQIEQLQIAVAQVVGSMPARPDCVVLSGAGEFVASEAVCRVLPTAERISISQCDGPAASVAAPAHALAVLAREAELGAGET